MFRGGELLQQNALAVLSGQTDGAWGSISACCLNKGAADAPVSFSSSAEPRPVLVLWYLVFVGEAAILG